MFWKIKSNTEVHKVVVIPAALSFLIGISGCTPGSDLPIDPSSSCLVTPATFKSWFESGFVTLNGEVKPADSINFSDVPNCDFYSWSEQMFLWLTSPTPASYGGGGGLIFNSPAFFDVSPSVNNVRTFIPHVPSTSGPHLPHAIARTRPLGEHGLPVVRDEAGRAVEIAPTPVSRRGLPLIRNRAGELTEAARTDFDAGGRVIFFDQAGKAIELPPPPPPQSGTIVVQKFAVRNRSIFATASGVVVKVEPNQALGAVLMAQNGSLVFYMLHVNDVFAYFVTGVKTGAFSASTFPTDSGINDVINFAQSRNKNLHDPQALAIEVKTSWVEAVNLPPGCKYITMSATIPNYVPAPGQPASAPLKLVESGHRNVQLAMVGMHVVGSTKGHPEMIWATYEHVCNAPQPGYTYRAAGNVNKPGPLETGPWLFSASDTPNPANIQRMNYNGTSIPPTIDALGSTPVGPSDILRTRPWGMPGNSAISNSEVILMNNSVRTKLIPGDIRWNYIMTGATWTIGGVFPAGQAIPIPGAEVGTNQLANTTMETYQQGMNCFACHRGHPLGTVQNGNASGISHIYGELQPLPP
jgi:hypothetical protein